jgi:hypothetical protein
MDPCPTTASGERCAVWIALPSHSSPLPPLLVLHTARQYRSAWRRLCGWRSPAASATWCCWRRWRTGSSTRFRCACTRLSNGLEPTPCVRCAQLAKVCDELHLPYVGYSLLLKHGLIGALNLDIEARGRTHAMPRQRGDSGWPTERKLARSGHRRLIPARAPSGGAEGHDRNRRWLPRREPLPQLGACGRRCAGRVLLSLIAVPLAEHPRDGGEQAAAPRTALHVRVRCVNGRLSP